MQFLSVLALSIWFCLADDDCTFNAGTIYPAEKLIKCLRNLPYSKGSGETQEMLLAVKEYLASYAYRDSLITPPEHCHHYDILNELKKVEEKNYDNGLDFHQDIALAFNKLKDAHTNYIYPCSNFFAVALPYRFEFEVKDLSKPNDIVVRAQQSLQPSVTEEYLKDGGINITGKKITKLELPDVPGSGEMSPEKAIAAWSDLHVPEARSSNARLSYALSSDFSIRMPAFYTIPTEKVKVTYEDVGGTTPTIELPWYSGSGVDIPDTNTMLTKICPPTTTSTNSTINDGSSASPASQADVTEDIAAAEEAEYQRLMEENKDNEFYRTILTVIHTHPELKRVLSPSPQNPLISMLYESPLMKALKRQRLDGDKNKRHTGQNGKRSSFSQLVAEKLNKEKDGESKTEKIYSGGGVSVFTIPSQNTTHLSVETFAPEGDSCVVLWITGVATGLVHAKETGHRLVVDLRGNGGGLIVLSDWLFSLFFPESYPIFPTRSIVASEYAKVYIKSLMDHSVSFVTQPETMMVIDDLWNETKTEVEVTGDDGVKRSRLWVQRFVSDTERYLRLLTANLPLSLRTATPFTSDNLVFVTDGTCGSACSQFLKRAKEKGLCRVVGLGGIVGDSTIPFDIASFASGNVIGTNEIEEKRPKTSLTGSLSNEEGIQVYPRKLPRTATIRISLSTSYSFDRDTPDAEPEFKVVEPDEILPIYTDAPTKHTPAKLEQLAQELNKLFLKCYSWQTKVDMSCPSPTGNPHSLYGNPCVNGVYDATQCRFARCERGFYLNKLGVCAERPSMGPAPFEVDPVACTFKAGDLGAAEEFLYCMKQMPFSAEEKENTLKSLEETLMTYAYRDTIGNPPAPFTQQNAVDILGELQKIRQKTYTHAIDFHTDIKHAVDLMKDPHTQYSIPCAEAAAFALPYRFEFEVADATKPKNIVVRLKELAPSLTNLSLRDTGANLVGREVVKITLDDIDVVNEEKPELTIARWCEKYVPYSRTPAARLSYGLAQFFFIRSFQQGTQLERSVNVTVRAEEGDGVEVYPLRFYGTVAANCPNSTALYTQYCPLRSSSALSAGTTAGSGAVTGGEDTSAMAMAMAQLLDTMKMTPAEKKQRTMEKIKAVRMKYKNDPQFVRAYERMMSHPEFLEELEREKVFNPSLEDLQPLGVKALLKIIKKEWAMKGNASTSKSTPRLIEGVQADPLGQFYDLLATRIDEWKIVYCYIGSFSPPDEESIVVWFDMISRAVKEAKTKGYRMVFDLRGNGGGLIVLGAQLYHMLFPQNFPINARYAYVRSNLTDTISSRFASKLDLITDYETLEEIKDITKLPTKVKKTTIVGGTERNQTWSGTFSVNSDRRLYSLIDEILPKELQGKTLFDPNDLLFIADGRCGSTCSQFLKHVKETQMAKVVGVGGALVNEDIPFDIASFAAGNVISQAVMDYMRQEVPPKQRSEWPSPLPRVTGGLSWSMMTGYSFDWATQDEELEFKIVQPDAVYPAYPAVSFTDGFNYLTVLEKVKGMLDTCYNWQVKVNLSCEIPEKDKAEHKIYGNPCQNGKFTEDCVFARCADGYYMNKEGKCTVTPRVSPLPKPDPTDPTDPEDSKDSTTKLPPGTLVAIIVGGVVLACGIVAAIVIVVVVSRNNRRRKLKRSLEISVPLVEEGSRK